MAQQQQQQQQQQNHSNNNSILLLQHQQPQQQQEQLQQYNNNLYSQNYNMEEYERRKRREREKIERQQGIQIDDRETSLFGEPRRLTEGDANITAALGEFGVAREYFNQMAVGISRIAPCSPRLQAPLPPQQGKSLGHSPSSASAGSTSASSATSGLPGQQQQHYQQQQRPPTYLKQADNKPPYNGRGGYPGQPMKNDIPSSSGMAPPRGPPRSSSSSSNNNNNINSSSATNNASSSGGIPASTPLGPPLSTQMPNGREKSFLGPPPPTLHNGTGGRFVPPAVSKRPGAGQQPPPPEKDVNKIISDIASSFWVTPLTSIAATPHAPTRENYNLGAPNKQKYAIDMIGSPPSAEPSPLFPPIAPMSSPIAPLLTTPPQASQLPLGGATGVTTSAGDALAPLHQLPPTPPKAASVVTSPALAKPLKTEKNHSLEKQDSCLENDLELSESDEDPKKEGRSAGNSSNSSESDSSESGSESSSKNDLQHHPNHQQPHQQLQQQQQQQTSIQQQQQQVLQQQHRTQPLTSNGAQNKKFRHEIIARGSNTITGLLSSSGFASGGSGGSGANSNASVAGGSGSGGTMSSGGSSSNKTPSPTESNKWTLSRFFHKPANQTNSESVSPGNVSMKVPGILPGGAQIIPESIDVTTAIVKNEKIHDDHMAMDEGEEEDDDEEHQQQHQQQQQQMRYGTGLSVTPVAVKKEAIDAVSEMALGAAIPKNQIKRESAEAHNAARLSDSGTSASGSSSSSSSSSSSDSGATGGEVVPMPGPGETLQLPGVPAAITTVMRVPPTSQSQKAPASNSVTLTPILPLPTSPKQRQKKPRKKKAVTSAPILDSSDDDEPLPKHPGLEHSALTVQAQPAVDTVKKGRGRPRKQQQSGGSGNLSSASAGSSSQTKGPTLTAAKKPLAKTPLAMSRARKRDHSSQSSSNGNTPTKKLATPLMVAPTLKPKDVHAASSSSDDDSSSSGGSSSKSSSSSSSSDDTETQNTNCRIVKLNKTGAVPPKALPGSGSSSPSSSGSDQEDLARTQVGGSGQSLAQHMPLFKQLPDSQHSQHSQHLSSSECSSSSGGCGGGGGGGGSSSSGEEDEARREKERERKPKNDKNKINTLARIFNPKEGGAKKQGQVVIMDLQEEQQQGKLDAVAQPPVAVAAAVLAKARMTTPTQQQQLGAGLASPARTTTPHLTSLICKIDLSKLSRERIMRLKKLTPAQQNGHLTPKEQGQTTPAAAAAAAAVHVMPNGYAAGDTNSATKVKHEHPVKPEPELDAGYEAKFKPSVKQEFQLKQERDRDRERERERERERDREREREQPPGRRRKRSSSSSSSPYKEKKRKKEKADQLQIGKELLPVAVLLPSNNHERMPNHDRLSYDKLQLLHEDAAAAAAAAAAVVVGSDVSAANGSPSKKLLAMSPLPPPPTVANVALVAPTTCNEAVQTTPPMVTSTAATATAAARAPPPAPVTRIIYRSYFDREEEHPSDDHRKNNQFLQEAINRKHAADSERDSFNQVTLYLEAVVYFLLTADAMERCSSEAATYTMYKDTLSLIKFISTKFRPYQQSTNGQHETHNKVAILSLRCQSLISLKLFKLRRVNCRAICANLTDFFRVGRDIVNGNTPSSISPSNSVGSQGSGSNTPPGKIVPQDVHNQLSKQNEYLNYVSSAHELWDQADRLVRSGNHIDFFRELDHENGPLTLHSTMHEVFRYVQAGLKTLRDAVSHPTHQSHQSQ
ncbi:AF4/FMR2 family member lilli isoform X1 [Drosophila elegans]|uniref:AF4/FMR2 family member lilli isoform X1 n=1 Tax=Drosophila elegans TaxID=30023 RepID=UPI0007E60F46|nr:AF4/FMR2 family member lilli isoform X1 [Drosophila elegans]XP_017116660.1 AF4/FMR2 family member lilli isoform X1 [Drosophila elegans]XP_017116661.1 AF4/FMR2 family member lilli isoform X1 [Drosophila elegans]